MSEWLMRARGGDPEALRLALSLKPWLTYHAEIAIHLRARMAAQDHTELVKIAHAFKQGPRLSKHAAIGLILVCCHDNQQAPDTSADSGKGRIHAQDLVQAFGYSPATARSYPSLLRRQEFRQRIGPAYHLTERRAARLRYFEVSGCPHPPRPLCQAKTSGYTCARCKYRLAGSEARILHEKDLWLMVRHPGVFVPGAGRSSLRKLKPFGTGFLGALHESSGVGNPSAWLGVPHRPAPDRFCSSYPLGPSLVRRTRIESITLSRNSILISSV